MNTSANKAVALAANFQVTELEPRLENAWLEVPSGPGGGCDAGSGPNPEPTCKA